MRCICPRRYPYGNQIEILTCLCTHITAVVYTRGRGRRWTEGRADGHLIITHTQKVWVTLDAGCAATNEGRYVDTKYLGGWHLFFSLPMWKPIFSYFRLSKREKKKKIETGVGGAIVLSTVNKTIPMGQRRSTNNQTVSETKHHFFSSGRFLHFSLLGRPSSLINT